MLLLALLPCFLLSALQGTLACQQPWNSTLDRRWYSVGNPTGQEPRTNNAWPVIKEGAQPVRYCWYVYPCPTKVLLRSCLSLTVTRVKQSDKDNLQTILAQAIKKWDFAMQSSALQIITDQANGPNFCGGSGVHGDALQIMDVTNSESKSAGLTTQGYWGLEGHTEPGRHTLKFFVEYPQNAKRNPDPHDVVMMAHELGELSIL